MSAPACHKLYNWLLPSAETDLDARFAATTLDVSRGAKVIASILCEHLTDLAAQNDEPKTKTLMSGNDTEALARLMVFSLGQLYTLANERVQHFNDQAEKGAGA